MAPAYTRTTFGLYPDSYPDYRIMVLGGGGVLAKHLRAEYFEDAVHVDPSAWGKDPAPRLILVPHNNCDVEDWQALTEVMRLFRPTVVINCAAIGQTDLSQPELDKERAIRVNAVGATRAALAARSIDADFIQISTDYVFPGTSGPYHPRDLPLPIQAFGLSKRLGELGVLAVHPRAIVLRLGWLFGIDYPNCEPMKVENGTYEEQVGNVQGKHRVAVIDDVFGSAVHVRNAAQLILTATGFFRWSELPTRIFHIASSEAPASWYQLLRDDYPNLSPVHGHVYPFMAVRGSPRGRLPMMGGLVPSPDLEAWSTKRGLKYFQKEVFKAKHERLSKG